MRIFIRGGHARAHLRGMVGVVVEIFDAVALAVEFKATLSERVLCKRFGALFKRDAQFKPDGDGCYGVYDVVRALHVQLDFSERFTVFEHRKRWAAQFVVRYLIRRIVGILPTIGQRAVL
ncbi:hypothetical protein SDC9_161122 [bioreactor metagenome]|uniref:Uncharacterized protein n=1 Tax=bioreactor metagenome TaxID=1076179 RepID=A0A645FJH0_9ZZZZ